MAYIERGGNSFRIKVSCGYDEHGKQVIRSMTWTPDGRMTPKQMEKAAEEQAKEFERKCKNGTTPYSKPIKFSKLVDDWLDNYAKAIQLPESK